MIKPHRSIYTACNRVLAVFFLLTFSILVPAQDAAIAATWQVQKYDIAATLPQSETDRDLTAKAKLEIKNVSTRPASTLTLRISPSAAVSAINVNGSNVDFTKGEEKIGTGSLQRVVVRMPAVQPGGSMAVTVDYKLNVKENSGVSSLSPVP